MLSEPCDCCSQLLKEEELGREVLSEKVVMLRQMWESAQDTACKVLPLAADTRSTYAGQMRRLEQLALQDKDIGTWHYVIVGYLSVGPIYSSVCCAFCLPSKAWLAMRLACLALQAVLSAHAAFAPRARLFQDFLRTLRSQIT